MAAKKRGAGGFRPSKDRPIRLPETIRVGYRTVRLEWWDQEDALDQNSCGEWRPDIGRIRIAEGQPADEAQNTLLHEVLHACLKVADTRIEHEAEEHVVHKLANVLLQVLHDNPELVSAITARVEYE
jgi:hypothetical protein